MDTIDSAYRIVQYISEAVGLFGAGVCFYLLSKYYVEKKRTAAFAGITYVLATIAVLALALSLGTFWTYAISVFSAFFALCMWEPGNYEQKLFLAVTFFSMRGFSDGIAEIVYDNVYSYAEKTAFMRAHENLYLLLYIGMCILFHIVKFSCMAGGIACIVKASVYRGRDLSKRWFWLLLLIPALTGAMGFFVLGYYRNFYMIKNGQNSDAYDFLASLYYAASLAAVLVAIALYESMKAKQEQRLQQDLLASQMESMQLHIEHVEGLYREIRGMRHDMANHIHTLEQLYEENQTSEARAYGLELKSALARAQSGIASGNPVTDVVLQMYNDRAKKQGIPFCARFYYPVDCGVNAFDVSIILNNALQNALEHTNENGGHISVGSCRRNNAYLIEITNSFAGSLLWDRHGLPRSSKGAGHGYGLVNIQRVAQKYAGDIEVSHEDGEFRLTVMLMLEEKA